MQQILAGVGIAVGILAVLGCIAYVRYANKWWELADVQHLFGGFD